MSQETRTPEQIAQDLAQALELVNQLKREKKALEGPKGQKIKFLDDEGREVEGNGVLYYYVQLPNKPKPIWKKATKCTVIE